ncbi:MAG: hypothetical protein CMM07_16130 [Rhodopirellula sp.]|nr:hypothetical protein [Rhodopirellula sp.]
MVFDDILVSPPSSGDGRNCATYVPLGKPQKIGIRRIGIRRLGITVNWNHSALESQCIGITVNWAHIGESLFCTVRPQPFPNIEFSFSQVNESPRF